MHVTVVLDRESTPAELKALSNLCLALAGEQPTKRDLIEYEVRIDTKQAQEDLRKFSEAANRDHELHEAGPLIDGAIPSEAAYPVTDLPPPGTFTAEEITANDPPFAPAAGALTTSAPAAEPAPTNASAVELDADGLPWDERIHSSNHKKTSDGKWWAKRGVDDIARLKVEAELRALLEPLTSADGSVDPTHAPVPPPPPAPAASSAPPPPPPPPPVKTELPFPLFVKALNTHNNDKSKTRIETLTINQAIIAMGIAPAVLPTMAKQENWPRLGELAQMIGLEGVA
jgi:hypothetical protein